ncbi:vWA domain-containing protein [Acidipropionibacterium jensenii]|uniref:vWA domain-containing protein n=1 Tax=Acidipropionibacterium jensenii TaxID=1749 RepID=UPI001386DD4D|nr:VWA domain-containing protein [Acidipropionibacterium jensenii]
MRKSDVGGGTRMAAAQDAASKFVSSLPKGSRVGLVSYGDKTLEEAPRSAGCGDVSLKVPVGSDIGAVTRQVKTLRPVGWTPIGKALQTAAAQAKGQPLNVVLITDGEDSCAPPDPCQTAATLAADNAGLSISAIGLNASSDQLSCIASKGKGYFVTASNSAQLARRLEALGDPDAASRTLSPSGVQSIRPGQLVDEIRKSHPGFPKVDSGAQVRVVWMNCTWTFSAKGVLTSIALEGSGSASTIDGLRVGDAAAALNVLGAPVSTSTNGGVETRLYPADVRLGLGWKVQIKDGRIITIVLCTCLTGSCPPSVDQIRKIQDDPTMNPTKISCIDDGNWVVVESNFQGDHTAGWLLLQRTGGGWTKVKRVTHGGDCYELPEDAPYGGLEKPLGGFCNFRASAVGAKTAPITMDGAGPIVLGMTRETLEGPSVNLSMEDECQAQDSPDTFNGSVSGLDGYHLRFMDGKLTAMMVNAPGARTSSGARLGMSVKDLLSLYQGTLTVDKEHGSYSYTAGGRTLEFSSLGDSDMETDTVQTILVHYSNSPWAFC